MTRRVGPHDPFPSHPTRSPCGRGASLVRHAGERGEGKGEGVQVQVQGLAHPQPQSSE